MTKSATQEEQKKYTSEPGSFFFSRQANVSEKFLFFLHSRHKTRFYSLVKHYRKNGLLLCIHGSKRRLPSSAFSAETIERVVKFIVNVAEDQALLLPGGIPGFKRIDVKLLPSSLTKSKLWKMYQDCCVTVGQVAIGYSKLCDLWRQLCPVVVNMTRRTTTKSWDQWIYQNHKRPKWWNNKRNT